MDLTRNKRVCFASTFEIHFLSIVFISCSIFSIYPTHVSVVSSFCIFHFCFYESSVSFIFRIDSLATRETIIAVLFCLFSGFYCFLSHIYIYIYIYLDCTAKLVLFDVGFICARTVRR